MTEKAAKPILKLKRPRSIQRSTIPKDPKEFLPLVLRQQSPVVWDPEQPQPLAVGIHQQIIDLVEEKGVSRTAVRRFLKAWTSMPAYQEAMSRPGASRCNVDGSPAGEVIEKHRRRAERRLETLREEAQAATAVAAEADAEAPAAQPAADTPKRRARTTRSASTTAAADKSGGKSTRKTATQRGGKASGKSTGSPAGKSAGKAKAAGDAGSEAAVT